MNPESELHALLFRLRDVAQRAEMHRERAKVMEREAAELRRRMYGSEYTHDN